MEQVTRELLAVAVAVECVAAVARVARRVGPAPSEEAETSRHGEGDRHSVAVEAVVLLVRVHPDDREDDRQDGERREHDSDHDLADPSGVHMDPGATQLADAISRLAAASGTAWHGRCRPPGGGGGHCDREIVVAARTPSQRDRCPGRAMSRAR